ncbi:MAG: MFS transporter [Proteobacteria bacterium]|nr:MFS transporter [Pseudomonadota bacterium]
MSAARKPFLTARQWAVGIAGYFSFINLYSPQAILPLLAKEFGTGAAGIATIMTVSTLAVALTAPVTGTAADVLGRKRVIITAMFLLTIPTLMCALSYSLNALIFWRFVQGLVLPPVFAVTLAYIGDEWEPHEVTSAAGIYMSGASLGGFSGRFFTGIFADLFGWRTGMMIIAAATLAGAIAVTLLLPREKKFVRSEGLIASGRQMLLHFRNGQLLSIFAVGFGVLFCFVLAFTFINFRLAAPPFSLPASWLGAIFVVYLVGSGLAPMVGWAVNRFGRKQVMIPVFGIWIGGILLTMASSLWLILVGLTICASCGLICQAIATGFVSIIAKVGRSSAVGLYMTSFYAGGAFGAAVGGVAWTLGGWSACAALLVAMVIVMALIVQFLWVRRLPPPPPSATLEPA